MSEHDRVLELLVEALDSGRTPEEVCAASPELRPAVRACWERCRRLDALLDDLFPPAGPSSGLGGGSGSGEQGGSPRPRDRAEQLPSVPGYVVEAVLGRGGVGVVYRASHLRLKRTVALKMLLSGAYAGRVERARFMREARAVAALRHAHVVQVYDVGEHDGLPFFTMEYVEGGTLAKKLGGAPLPAREAAALVEVIAGAVEAAHQAGIVHRDLKPANVLMATDGTPKVSDFGLALHADDADDELGLTLSGARLGTPSYMAPEQAVGGRRGAVGPPADVYALGAVLYETLTGRPPFRGESVAETERQVIHEEPVPPSRLNPRVPRDLETVCLKCLAKHPGRRYANAAALADDLGRFARGEPVAARRAGRAERAAKWARRRPAAAALWAGGVLVTLALGAGVALWVSDRAAAAGEVGNYLDVAVALQRQGKWAEANTALDRAASRLDGRHLPDLRGRLEQGHRDAALVDRLEAIRMRSTASSRGVLAWKQASNDYARAFRESGLIVDSTDVSVAAARVKASNVRPALISALYHWVRWETAGDTAISLMNILQEADAAPSAWQDRYRSVNALKDPAAAAAALADPTLPAQPPDLLLVVAQRLDRAGHDSVPFLVRVQQAHPADFWVNLTLSIRMRSDKRYPDAIRYGQAAVALRPESDGARDVLGAALLHAGRPDEAGVAFREWLRLDPNSPYARSAVAVSLLAEGRHEEAVREFQTCLRSLPDDILVNTNLGVSLEALGRLGEAERHYRRAVAQGPAPDPTLPEKSEFYAAAQAKLRDLLERQGRQDEALAAWRQHFDLPGGPEDGVFDGYAEYHLFRGDEQEYRRASGLLLDRAGASANPRHWEVMGRASLLTPPTEEELRRAAALIDRALASQSAGRGLHPFFMAAKALAEYRAGRYESAIKIMEGDAAGVLGPMPQIVVALARSRLGQPAAAREALARASQSQDWSAVEAKSSYTWMVHVLRREADALILPDLRAFLEGRYQPTDPAECLAMTASCEYEGLHAAHARLWARAAAADLPLAVPGRLRAIRAAVLAGCGSGKDAASLSEIERASLRRQAREWLDQELAALAAETGGGGDGAAAQDRRDVLRRWSSAPELAVVRDEEGLAALPTDEAREWRGVWERCAALLRTAKAPARTAERTGRPATSTSTR